MERKTAADFDPELLVLFDAYRSEARQAGSAFVEIQNTMLFATVGERE